MSGRRWGQAAAALLWSALALGTTVPAASAAASAAPSPTPSFPIPSATSTVGGADLSGDRELVGGGVPAPPEPKAVAWLVADLDSRSVIAGRRVHTPLATASTMKIFTALAIAPTLDPKQVYTAVPADANIDGTKVGLVPGSRYTVDMLLHGMLMSSGNDCANAIGNLAGGQAKAVAMMQEKARGIGALDTVPRTTSGLDAPGQVSSAYDLALAGSAALQVPQLEKIMTTKTYQFPMAGTSFATARKRFSIQTHNKLIYNVPGATGVKNGYTVAARGSFVGSATRNGHSYIAVVLRAEGNTWHETDDLLQWAFRYGPQAESVGHLVRPGEQVADPGQGVEATDAQATPPMAAAKDGGLRGTLPAKATSSFPLADELRDHGIWVLALVAALTLMVTGLRLRRARVASGGRRYAAPTGYGWDAPPPARGRRPPPQRRSDPPPDAAPYLNRGYAPQRPRRQSRTTPPPAPPAPPGATPARHRR